MNLDFIDELKGCNSTQRRVWYNNLSETLEGCLTCNNKTNHDGYLRVSNYSEGRLVMAHVLVWETLNGSKPEGMEINHKCGNRKCVNPEHLEIMDGSEHATHTNVNRVGYKMDRKTDAEVAEFYYQVKYNDVAINEIVRQHGIKRSTMSSIMNKRSRYMVTDAVDNYVKALTTFM